MKGTVPKRLDICFYFGTFYTILNFYFLIVVPSATQHTKFLTRFIDDHQRTDEENQEIPWFESAIQNLP